MKAMAHNGRCEGFEAHNRKVRLLNLVGPIQAGGDHREGEQAAQGAAVFSTLGVHFGDGRFVDPAMNAIEIQYRDIQNNTRFEKKATCTSLSKEGAIAVAVDLLDATELKSGEYIYFAREAGAHYVVDADELMVLGAAHFCRSGSDVYSLWCQDTGREATDCEIAEIDG